MYTTIDDAYVVLGNSGVIEWFDYDQTQRDSEVVRWMWDNDATPEDAAKHFGVTEG